MTQPRRPLLNSEIKKDWVVITSLVLGAMTSYNSVTSSFFVNGNQQFGSHELLAASIDSIIGTAITFFLLVAILGSVRRRMSKSDVEVSLLESEITLRKLKIALLIVVVSLASLFVAYTNAAAKNSDLGSSNSADPGLQIETRPRTCHSQGVNEMCVSAFGVGKSATFNYELNYKFPQDVNGYQVSSSTWEVSVDCVTKTISARQLKFFSTNQIEIPIAADVIQSATKGIETDMVKLLDAC